jgi:exoribonuclease-2
MSLINSLVAYKGKPARITNVITHKFDLEFADGSIKKVREKDFRFIHPEFAKVSEVCANADISVLAEFQEEVLSLQEITEWLFDEYNAQNAWCTCLMVEEGLYFYWQKDSVFVRPSEQVQGIIDKRDVEKMAAESLQHCITNLKNNTFEKQDIVYLEDIAKVALNQSKHAKILEHIGVENNEEAAYKFLLKIKYFTDSFNPYPARFSIPKDKEIEVSLPKIQRIDLTSMNSYAIDNEGSNDADDAISVNGDILWIHIADVATIVDSGSKLDEYARERGANLYLPEQIIHMLPISITKALALGQSNKSPALSIGLNMKEGIISNIKVMHSTIKVINTTYDAVDKELDSNADFIQIQTFINQHKAFRAKSGAIGLNLPNVDVRYIDEKVQIEPQKTSPSRDFVAEVMVIAGRTIAQYAQENDIVMPYALQDEGDFPQEVLDKKDNLSTAESFKAIKFFKRSATSIKPLPHYGLGLNYYLRITSPLRRYYDLLAHQQLSNFIAGKPTLNKAQVRDIIGINNNALASVGRVTRFSNDHYKCLFLKQNPSWEGEGVVVDIRGDKALFMIPEVGLMTQIKFKEDQIPKPDDKIMLKVTRVDMIWRSANFKPV